MSAQGCVDRPLGELLAAYELQLLSDDEVREFEIHVMQCDRCLRELRGFQAQASLLRNSRAVRELLTTLEPAMAPTRWAALRGYLWPDLPLLLRPATIWAIVVLLVVPAYLGVRGWRRPNDGIRALQAIHLVPNRSLERNAFDARQELDGVISFIVPDAQPDVVYAVAIVRDDGVQILEIGDFDDVDARGRAALAFPRALMRRGDYSLLVRVTGQADVLAHYRFRVE